MNWTPLLVLAVFMLADFLLMRVFPSLWKHLQWFWSLALSAICLYLVVLLWQKVNFAFSSGLVSGGRVFFALAALCLTAFLVWAAVKDWMGWIDFRKEDK